MKMKNNNDKLFISIFEMLKNPDDYNDFSVDVMIATLGIINDRILEVDSDILNQQITKEEYETHYSAIFNSTFIEMSDIIDNLKSGDTKNEN